MNTSQEYDSVESVDALVDRIAGENCIPGWVRHERPLMWARPRSSFAPAHWQYARI